MKYIKTFILGILFYIVAIPIIESIGEILSTGLEYIKGKTTIPVLKVSKDIQILQADLSPVDTVAMGFQYNGNEDDFYEDDEFDDKKKSKIKCGFGVK